jgi:hypothetical protein
MLARLLDQSEFAGARHDESLLPATWRRRFAQLGREAAASAGTSALAAAATVAALGRRSGSSSFSVALGAAAAGLVVWQSREGTQKVERQVRSAEDAAVLSAALGRAAPLYGRWAAEADFAAMVVRELERTPRLVVECGSGATTIVIADALLRAGAGRLVSLEHDGEYAHRTERLLESAGLRGVARVVEAPLRAQAFGDRVVDWYDRSVVEASIEEAIDVLVVDGPPQTSGSARWPALHVFRSHLGADPVVLLDDGRTWQATAAAYEWVEGVDELDLFWIDTVKGTWLLRRGGQSNMSGPLLRIARLVNPRPSGGGRWPVHR